MHDYATKPVPSQVKATGKVVCRDTIRVNVKFLKLAIEYLGHRVAIPTLETHMESFYDFVGVPCSRFLIASALHSS